MTRKPTAKTTTTSRTEAPAVTRDRVRKGLDKASDGMPADEEKALRMLHGAGGSRTMVLGRVGQDNEETREKLLSMELELLRQWRARGGGKPATAAAAPANPKRTRIVEALKKKPVR